MGFLLALKLVVDPRPWSLKPLTPTRHTPHFWDFFWAPFGENTFSKNAPNEKNKLEGGSVMPKGGPISHKDSRCRYQT